eukprot:scaffold83210_cov27-Tisochrysis_lutea.AAC.2
MSSAEPNEDQPEESAPPAREEGAEPSESEDDPASSRAGNPALPASGEATASEDVAVAPVAAENTAVGDGAADGAMPALADEMSQAAAESVTNGTLPPTDCGATPTAADGDEAAVDDKFETSWLERARARKAALKTIQAREKAELGEKAQANAKERLAYLMRQTDIFAHFMGKSLDDLGSSNTDKVGSNGLSKSGPGRRTKGRMTEKQEDELLLKAAETDAGKAGSSGTRLTTQPTCIMGKMRAYQLEGLNWLIKLYEHGINGILADEMGLGKTLQTISLLGYLREFENVRGPHLIIVPKSVLINWFKEVEKWCPSIRAFKFHGDKATRLAMKEEYFEAVEAFDVCITTFETAISEKAAIEKIVWRYLIIDEAHRIKNDQGKLSQVVRLFSTHYRLLITGTPLQNNLHELWSMLNFLLPDIFSSSEQFDEWFNPDDAAEQKEDVLHHLHRLLRPFLLRRLKAEVEKDLPPKREIKLLIGMSEMQRMWYQNILTKNIEVLNAMSGNRSQMHNILMQLRKCANHPYLFDGAEEPPFTNDERLIVHSGKMVLLDKLLIRLKSRGHRVLIFSQMTRMLDILEDYCSFRSWEYCRIDGSTSGEERDAAMEVYNAPESSKFLFLLSTRAGGLGINLATADTVIIFDSDWNPQMDLQAMDRAHRIGQTREVAVYRFMIEGSVEEKIIERAQRKLYLDAAIIQQGRLAEQSTSLSKEEMLGMIRFGADAVFSAKGKEPTDEDIEQLLARGEERTRADAESLRQTTNNLANFKLDGQERSLYEYEGQDWSAGSAAAEQWCLSLPKRITKQNYDENEYYKNIARERGGMRMPKQTQIHDFQFFNSKRLGRLRDKEVAHWQWKQDRILSRRAKEEAEEDEETLLARAIEAGSPPLTPEEEEEKQELLREGFSTWNKKDFNAFVKACERHGRQNLAAVANEVRCHALDVLVGSPFAIATPACALHVICTEASSPLELIRAHA